MRRPPFLPSPIALVSGALSFVLLVLFASIASIVVPQLVELGKTSPRLAMTGFLALVVSPALVVVVVHHVGHRSLDGIDPSAAPRSVFPKLESWWAGAHAWLVLYGTSVLASLVMLIVDPPEFDDALGRSFVGGLVGYVNMAGNTANALSLHTMIWVFIAAELYELERRARRR